MTKYQIDITHEAKKWVIKKLNKEQARRFMKKLKKLEDYPDIHGKPLRHQLSGIWEIYFEKKFRVLYKIDYNSKTVKIITIKHKDEM